ncbi:ImmA/IrrE family metallo-endopeptidase [Corynebacteriales bacterium D3-21]|uniref:ImmA/IrrE family metallo-endopeptidase n=1 Tax=Speluncibacter jeojiensis TaxID=2710754 RepID=A0A9X4M393_9ACTN|nr:ImmA/IrrE family metallo-endopeptidase [Corynebacteriales bacterium D3-21]
MRQARLVRRLTAKSVLEDMGWKGARLTRMERSEVATITMEELRRLSEIFAFPATFFTTAPVSRVEPEDLSFRAPKSTLESEKNRMAQMMALSGDFLLQLDAQHKLPPLRLTPRTDLDPAAAAAAAREQFGIGPDAPITDLTHLLERHGVPVMMRGERFGGQGLEDNHHGRLEKHLGCSAWIGEFKERPLIALRELDSWERTRWTVAHELGHLMLHVGIRQVSEEHERQASRFASEFLAPFAAASQMVRGEPSLVNLLPVKDRWGISLGALLPHFYGSGAMSTDRYEMLRKQLYTRVNTDTGFTWGRTEPGWDDRAPERPRLMSKWIEFIYGTSSAKEIALVHNMIWPGDLIVEITKGQRVASTARASTPRAAKDTPTRRPPVGDGVVTDFASYRSRERQA